MWLHLGGGRIQAYFNSVPKWSHSPIALFGFWSAWYDGMTLQCGISQFPPAFPVTLLW